MLGEYLTPRREDPSFEPARPVVSAYVRQPVDAPPQPLVTDPVTARVLDVFNVSYEVLLYVLGRFFGHGHETPEQLKVLALLELRGYLDATVAQHPHLGDVAGVGGALQRLADRMATAHAGLAGRHISIPPAWGVGAVGS